MIQLTLQTMETPNHAYAHPKLARAQVVRDNRALICDRSVLLADEL